MSIKSELDYLFSHTIPMEIDHSFKGFFVADLHVGVRDKADDFQKNEAIYLREILEYKHRGFKIIGLGDILELWENSKVSDILKAYSWMYDVFGYRIEGNHDGELDLPQAILLQYQETGKKILCVHGHQGDFFNDDGYPLGRFFVRHIWRNLQMLGFKDPTTATSRNLKKHFWVRQQLQEWANENQQTLVSGHTHFAEHEGYFWNAGSWTGAGGSGIEIIGESINLKKFK